jgi:hypothetical protein
VFGYRLIVWKGSQTRAWLSNFLNGGWGFAAAKEPEKDLISL